MKIYLIIDNKPTILTSSNLHTNDRVIDPDYLEKGEFTICSTCTGFGDWATLSAMPRLLKKKYPHCKVYIPSKNWLMKVLNPIINYDGAPYVWPDRFYYVEKIFNNNPYIDGFKDDISGIVYTECFRYGSEEEIGTPLVKKMLRFYGLTDDEIGLAMPEIYLSDEDVDYYTSKFIPSQPYGCLTLSTRWSENATFERAKAIKEVINFYKIPIIYFGDTKIEDTHFRDYSNVSTNLIEITNDIWFQTFIRMNARYNVGNQTGVLEILPKYSETFMLPHVYEDFKFFAVSGVRYLDV